MNRSPMLATLALLLAGHAAEAQPPAPQAAADEIRDIRGPKPLGGNWAVPVIVALGLLTGAAAYGYWLWSRRRAHLPRTPVELALARLAAAQTLIDAQNGREFSIEVSGIVREYIEQQFAIRAAHRTTDEFLHDLVEPALPDAAHRALAAHSGNLSAFLETCDLAKFGGWTLSAADMRTLSAGAMRFVSQSAPTPADSPQATPPRHSYAAFPST